jgi:hypothetical protein
MDMANYFELRDGIACINRVFRDLDRVLDIADSNEGLQNALIDVTDELIDGSADPGVPETADRLRNALSANNAARQTLQQRIADALAPHTEQLRSLEIDITAPDFIVKTRAIQHAFDAERERVRKSLIRTLVERGWYLSWDMLGVTFYSMEELMAADDPDQAEQVLIEHARSAAVSVRDTVCGTFPERAEIIQQAFNAHVRGEYALCISTLLPQADWMSRQAVNASIFEKDKGAVATATKFDHLHGKRAKRQRRQPTNLDVHLESVRAREFEPLRYLGSVHLDSAEANRMRDEQTGIAPFSRHATMHGDDPNYATELNSLRAIMLLSFLVRAFSEFQTGSNAGSHTQG